MSKRVNNCLTIISIAAVILLINCKSGQQQLPATEFTPVEIQPAIEKEHFTTIHTSGVLQSSAAIKLSFKIGGIVEKILIHESEQVKKGQVLAELKMTEINAQVEHAKTARDKAVRDYERAKILYDGSAASLQQKQDAESGLQVAVSNLAIAEFNMRYAQITAPENGKILKQLVEENEMVEAGYPALVFGSTDKSWIIKAYLTDKDIVKVHYGDSAHVQFDAWPEKLFKAVVSEISEAAEANSGLFKVELRLINKPARFISGLVAQVDIFSSTQQRYIFVPTDALVNADSNNGFIFTVNNSHDRAVRVPVKIVAICENEIAISGSLQQGDRVITAGASYLKDGDRIKVATTAFAKMEVGQ